MIINTRRWLIKEEPVGGCFFYQSHCYSIDTHCIYQNDPLIHMAKIAAKTQKTSDDAYE
jgi:hypothetical protein